MNPLLIAALGSILRWALAFLAGYLVNAGIWTSDESSQYVGAAALAILTLAWSLWQKYKSRIKFLAALDARAGTSEANLDTRGVSVRRIPVIVLAAVLSGLMTVGCATKVPPTVGPAGKIALQARTITDAAGTALKGIEVFTDQGLIPKPVAVQVITAIRQVGLAGNALADALRLYAQSRGADGGIEIRTTVQNIQRLVTDALVLVLDLPTRQRIQTITQPILDALAAILIPFDDKLEPSPDAAATVQAADWAAIVFNADAALVRLAH